MKSHILIFLVILTLGILLRLISLGEYPVGFFRDEAALGYNAYSIWKTDSDEYGVSLPLVFRSFEVFFLPAYSYLSAPIVGILGLNEWSTRLLSAISGIAALLLIYLITFEIWKNRKIALIVVFVLAISPWHVFYSRGALEGNLALTVFSAGFLFWLKFQAKVRVKFFFLSILFFALSMYCYQSERFVVPLFGVAAAVFSYKKLLPVSNKLILPICIVFIILLPLLSLTFRPSGYHRALGVSIFSDERRLPGSVDGTGLLINNELYLRTKQITALYLSYFSPRNLFSEGDFDKQRSVEKFSVFYSFMLPFLLIGIISVVKRKIIGEKLLLIWAILAPIPAALTTDPFHTYRSLMLYMPLSIFIGFGIFKGFGYFKKHSVIYIVALISISLINLSLFLYSFAVLTPATRASFWDFGYKEIVSFINSRSDYQEVRVDDPTTESYIHFLFFGHVDPNYYHSAVKKFIDPRQYYYGSAEEIRPPGFGKFVFRPVDWPTERGNSDTIFVMKAERLPPSEFETDPKIELLKEIRYPNGITAFRIVKIK